MKDGLLEKIKERGYWRINFQPKTYSVKIDKISDCRSVVENAKVSLRGWDYPVVPEQRNDEMGLGPADKFYEGWIDWRASQEFWRMYQSGQYIHYFALREDRFAEDPWYSEHSRRIKSMEAMGTVNAVFQMTEIFLFLERLTSSELYEDGVSVSIALNNTNGRKLWLDSKGRVPYSIDYKTEAKNIEYIKNFTKDEIIGNSKDLAFELILYVFDRFGWHNPNVATIRQDQDDLLNRKTF